MADEGTVNEGRIIGGRFTHPAPTLAEITAGVLIAGVPTPQPEPVDPVAAEISERLSDWWQEISTGDMMGVVPKAVEYGSADLKIMGAALIALHPNASAMDDTEKEQVGQEMAIAFYLLGKVSRLFGAYERGGRPSDDTWLDVTVYSMMGRRVREAGGWPA